MTAAPIGTMVITHDELDARVRADCRAQVARLTDRERDVLILASKGCNHREIADRLSRGKSTIELCIARLHTKLGVETTIEAAVIAAKAGVV